MTAAQAGGRFALVFGNSIYASEPLALKNPARDAQTISDALEEQGFSVTRAVNQDHTTMRRLMDKFRHTAADADVAVVFFAGHGVQIKGENHLLGSDFAVLSPQEVTERSITLSEIVTTLKLARPRHSVIILDACRNNPFSADGRAVLGLARARGTAGMLIAYATDPGSVAYDGTGSNSFFTTALVSDLGTKGLDARLMLGRVRQQVALATKGAQVPWVEDSLLGEFSFSTDAPAAHTAGFQDEIAVWRQISLRSRIEDYEDYLNAFPNGLFSTFARSYINSLGKSPTDTSNELEKIQTMARTGNRQQMVVALNTLGLLSHVRSTQSNEAQTEEAVVSALQLYFANAPNDLARSESSLYLDASRILVQLGATTSRSIRIDMVALAGINKSLAIATDAQNQLQQIVATKPEYQDLLSNANLDIENIVTSREKVLARLDKSRIYYDELLRTAEQNFDLYLDYALPQISDQARDVSNAALNVTKGAGLFVDHARKYGNLDKKGSMKWLSDLVPNT